MVEPIIQTTVEKLRNYLVSGYRKYKCPYSLP